MSETILEEAERIVGGERQEQYGDVRESFIHISELWSAYLGKQLSVFDVAHLMMLLKISRNSHNIKRDNLTDVCGYARCAEKLLEVVGLNY